MYLGKVSTVEGAGSAQGLQPALAGPVLLEPEAVTGEQDQHPDGKGLHQRQAHIQGTFFVLGVQYPGSL